MADRSTIAGYNAFINGMGHLAVVESGTPPAIKYKKQKQTSGVGDRDIATGMVESLDAVSTFKALPSAIYEEIAKLDNAEIIYKSGTLTGGTAGVHEHVCVGAISLEYEEHKNGEYLGVKLTQTGLKKWTHEIDGKVVVDIDHENMICNIGGTDIMADIRAKVKG